jgi:cytoskeletal protein RodZ
MTYQVTQSVQSYSVKLQSSPKFKISVSAEASSVAGSLTDLDDFNPSGVQDKYLVMYDAATQKYVTVNPDVVLSAASNTETTQPGLPQDFIDTLDVDLDNKIDLDAGGF